MKKRIVALAISLAVGAGLLTAAPAAIPSAAPRADASSFWVVVGWKSDTRVDIYNKKGCLGEHNRLDAGESSSLDHDWKTMWVPAHHRMHILHYSSGFSYHIDNTHGYKTCHNIGKYFDPVGIEIWTTHL